MKRFIIVVYYWRRSQCSAKTECIQFSILKNACQPQLLSLKIGKKKSKDRKIKNIGKSFFVFYDFLAKIPVLGHILDCFSTLSGMYLMRFFSCPGQLSLTDILIQSLSRFYFTVLRAKLYFTSSSFGFWDIFGMLICILDRSQLHRFGDFVTTQYMPNCEAIFHQVGHLQNRVASVVRRVPICPGLWEALRAQWVSSFTFPDFKWYCHRNTIGPGLWYSAMGQPMDQEWLGKLLKKVVKTLFRGLALELW